MSAGSGASNLGYGSMSPFNHSAFVNGTSSNYSGNFSSTQIPGFPGLAGSQSNIDAAAGKVPGICLQGGGRGRGRAASRRLKKNISKRYNNHRMKNRSNKLRSQMRAMSLARTMARTRVGGRRGSRRRSRSHRRRISRRRGIRRGGGQFQNNMPMTQTYQVAGVQLPSSQLGLANPPPISTLPNCTNCVDNYNHFTNAGFPSKGH